MPSTDLEDLHRHLTAAAAIVAKMMRDAPIDEGERRSEVHFSAGARHLSPEGVRALHALFAAGFTIGQAAARMGISTRAAAARRAAWQAEQDHPEKEQEDGMNKREAWKRVTNAAYFEAVRDAILKIVEETGSTLADLRQNPAKRLAVRFGECGEGAHSNFQIVNADESMVWRHYGTRTGISRAKRRTHDSWNVRNLSEKRFTYDEVDALRAALV